MEVAGEVAIERDEGLHKPQCRVIAPHQLKDSMLIGAPEIQVAWRIAPQVDSCQERSLRMYFGKVPSAMTTAAQS
jgi:hypothetical protein